MTTILEDTIHTAQQLSVSEQWQLIEIMLAQLQKQPEQNHFWQAKKIEQLEQEQGKKLFKNLASYQADFLLAEESVDEWLDYFAKQHAQEL